APAKAVTGQFLDDAGKPIEGIRLRIVNCDRIEAPAPPRGPFGVVRRPIWPTSAAPMDLMPDQFLAVSDAQGRFTFDSVPADIICHVMTDHPDYGHIAFVTASTDRPPAMYGGRNPVLPLPIAMTLKRQRTATVKVVYESNGKPASGASVAVGQTT